MGVKLALFHQHLTISQAILLLLLSSYAIVILIGLPPCELLRSITVGTPIPSEPPDTCMACVAKLPDSLTVSIRLKEGQWHGDPPNPLPMTISGPVTRTPYNPKLYTGLYVGERFGGLFKVQFCQPPDNDVLVGFESLVVEFPEELVTNNHCITPICSANATVRR